MVFGSCAVRLSERVSACGQRHGFFVVHGHAAECFTNVLCAEKRVRVRVRALWVDVDQSHLHGSEWVLKVLARIAVAIIAKPFIFASPVNVVFWVPDVRSATAETKNGAAHGLDGDLTGQDEKVSPTDGVAVLLLDWPQQAAGFVEVAVVGPAVERSETLCARSTATTTVAGSIGSCCVPGHSDEEGAVVTVVGWPPILTVRHQGVEVFLQSLIVKVFEGLSIVKVLAHGVGLAVVLVEDVQIEVFWPPVLV